MNANLLRELFIYHQPTSGQIEAINKVREKAFELADAINSVDCEPGLQTLAIRSVHSASMHANAGIVLAAWEKKNKVPSRNPVEASARKIAEVKATLPAGWKVNEQINAPMPSQHEGGDTGDTIAKGVEDFSLQPGAEVGGDPGDESPAVVLPPPDVIAEDIPF